MKSFRNQWQKIGIALLVTCSFSVLAGSLSSEKEIKARAEYEQKKEAITSASEYIDKEPGPKTMLLQSTPKHDDALSVSK